MKKTRVDHQSFFSVSNLLFEKNKFTFLFILSFFSLFFIGISQSNAAGCTASWSSADGKLTKCDNENSTVFIPGQEMIFTSEVKDTDGRGVASYIYFPDEIKTANPYIVPPGYIASCENSSTCTAVAKLAAPLVPGKYFLGVDSCGTFNLDYGTTDYQCIPTWTPIFVLDVGSIYLSSNLPINTPTPFTVTGPSSLSSDFGSYFDWGNSASGVYTVTWGEVSGYETPPTESLTLTAGRRITFNANYVRKSSCVVPPPLNGTILLDGSSVTAYAADSLNCGSCVFEERVCNNGILSGTFTKNQTDCAIPCISIVGVCGSATTTPSITAPTTNLCSPGSSTVVTKNGSNWIWTCKGLNGGSNSPTCSASIPVPDAGWKEVPVN
jgi:hypothetical protein